MKCFCRTGFKKLTLGLTTQHKLCRQCCEKLESLLEVTSSSPASSFAPMSGQESDQGQISDQERTVFEEHELSILNESLDIFGESPLSKRKLGQESYSARKVQKINSSGEEDKISCTWEMLWTWENSYFRWERLWWNDGIVKGQIPENRQEKRKDQIIDRDPKDLDHPENSNTLQHIIPHCKQRKHLVKEKGNMSDPDPKPGKSLSSETIQFVEAFYSILWEKRLCLHLCSWWTSP